MANEKDVIMNVYIESSTKLRSQQEKKINPNTFSKFKRRVFRTQGYDRRAQLIAYTQQLRRGSAQQIQWPFQNSSPKCKKWRLSLAMQKVRLLLSRFHGRNGKWKYEKIIEEECGDVEETCKCNQEKMKKNREKKGNGMTSSNFCKKVKCLLKEITSGWQCRNGKC